MNDKRQFKLEVYSTLGEFQLLVDTFAGRLIRLPDMKELEVVGEEGNVLYVIIPGLRGKTALIHDNRFGVLSQIDIKTMHYFQSPYFYPVKKHKIVYFDSPKNASTSIASEFYNYFWRKFYQPRVTGKKNWYEIWSKSENLGSVWLKKEDYVMQKEYFAGWKKFTVYDDPIKRFLRVLNDKINGHIGIASIVQYNPKEDDISDFVDKMILAVQMQTLNSYCFDQHIVPLSLYLRDFIDEITDFVWLKDLDSFMLENLKIKPKHYHVTKNKKITYDMLTEKQISRLKELYKEDYELPERYKDKFYVPKSDC